MNSQTSEKSKGNGLLMAAAGLGLGVAGRQLLEGWRQADLRGNVALITGGSRGLGYLLARELAREGCKIAICARDEQELERVQRDLEQRGAEVLAVPCDIADRSQVEGLVDETTRQFGRVDVLVNNAGVIQVGALQDTTHQDFEEAMDIMFWGVLHPTLAVLPQMLERRSGRIVNITSIGGKVSVPHLLPYNCAKFAAVGLSEGLRAELRPKGISVITIVPGLMRTGSHINAFFKGQQEREFTWFSLGASLPLVSMDAERAARQIVRAARRGESERILSLPANALARFHGLFPGVTSDLLALAGSLLLPAPGGAGAERARGETIEHRIASPVLDTMTAFGRSASDRFHERRGPQ